MGGGSSAAVETNVGKANRVSGEGGRVFMAEQTNNREYSLLEEIHPKIFFFFFSFPFF